MIAFFMDNHEIIIWTMKKRIRIMKILRSNPLEASPAVLEAPLAQQARAEVARTEMQNCNIIVMLKFPLLTLIVSITLGLI